MDYIFLSQTNLFRGTTPEEIQTMLTCLHAQQHAYRKGEAILRAGDQVTVIGLVLSGSAAIEYDDFWGNKSLLDSVGAGKVFAETYACIPGEPLMVSVVAHEQTDVLLLDARRLLQTCGHACAYHGKLIRNLLAIASLKNLNLSRRIFHTSAKSIRGRLLSYLSYQAVCSDSRTFTIPFNRQELAEYLSVDRSALSGELGKMRREGLIEVEKNRFVLLTETKSML